MNRTPLAFCLRVVIFFEIAIMFADTWLSTEQRLRLETDYTAGIVSYWWLGFQDLLHIWANTAFVFVILLFAFSN